jgi:outer membrane lipoprotein carrier protein
MSFLLVLAWAVSGIGSSSDVQTIVHALEARYRHAQTLKAVFLEKYTDGGGGTVAESGTVYFSRPGRMRWEYESPEQKLFLVDGSNVWFYVPADHTASRAKLKQSSDWRTPLALLAGDANLDKLCANIQMVNLAEDRSALGTTPLSPGNALLKCTPRGGTDTDQSVLLETDSEGRLVRVVIREAGNSSTEFRFGNWEENLAVPEVKFHFQPPPGVAIVDEQSLGTSIR